ncbi:hypothetical protein YB2330_006477 [Saitoella coloradoensis]
MPVPSPFRFIVPKSQDKLKKDATPTPSQTPSQQRGQMVTPAPATRARPSFVIPAPPSSSPAPSQETPSRRSLPRFILPPRAAAADGTESGGGSRFLDKVKKEDDSPAKEVIEDRYLPELEFGTETPRKRARRGQELDEEIEIDDHGELEDLAPRRMKEEGGWDIEDVEDDLPPILDAVQVLDSVPVTGLNAPHTSSDLTQPSTPSTLPSSRFRLRATTSSFIPLNHDPQEDGKMLPATRHFTCFLPTANSPSTSTAAPDLPADWSPTRRKNTRFVEGGIANAVARILADASAPIPAHLKTNIEDEEVTVVAMEEGRGMLSIVAETGSVRGRRTWVRKMILLEKIGNGEVKVGGKVSVGEKLWGYPGPEGDVGVWEEWRGE